jgi:hypothetical protein
MNGLRTLVFGLVVFGVGPVANAQQPAAPSAVEKAPTAAAADKPATTFDGTLFFTPLQRREMDRDRKQRLTGSPAAQPEDVRSVINGVATRSDGRLTVWVDGQPRWENASARHLDKLSGADVGGSGGYLVQAGKADGGKAASTPTRKKVAKRPALQPRK